MAGFIIKNICENTDDILNALDLVWQVFLEFEAPEYPEEGIREFREFIEIETVKGRIDQKELTLWACFERNKIVGVIGVKPSGHISLLFVDKKYQRKGIAKALYKTILACYEINGKNKEITVNSSPYAVEVYRRLGFIALDVEQTVNGIRFVPMKHILIV